MDESDRWVSRRTSTAKYLLQIVFVILPMVVYMVSLYCVSISRETLALMTIIMVIMLNPLFCLPIGMVLKSMTKLLRKICGNIQHPLFVISLNAYLGVIGIIMYCLFKATINFRKASEFPLKGIFDFNFLKFDRCECPPGTTKDYCHATNDDYQNF